MTDIYELSKQFVENYAELFPMTATLIGRHRYDNFWGDLSSNLITKLQLLINTYKKQLDEIKIESIDDKWILYAIDSFYDYLDLQQQLINSNFFYYDLNSIDCTFHHFPDIITNMMPRNDKTEWDNILLRLEKLDEAFQEYTSRLRDGIKMNCIVSKRQVLSIIKQSTYLIDNFGNDLTNDVPKKYIRELNKLLMNVRTIVLPNFIHFLKEEYLPVAPNKDAVGLERYKSAVRFYVGKEFDLIKIYDRGFDEINKIMNEIQETSQKINPNVSLNELKTEIDKYLYVRTIDEFIDFINSCEQYAIKQLDKYFDIPEITKKITIKESQFNNSLTYYMSANEDFSRDGTVFYSKEKGKTIPLMDEVSTAYHEGFPGHHLQISIQILNKKKLSEISRLLTNYSSYSEGWALYTERLMDELNLYDKEEYKLGMLYNSLLRACRIVIDIGLHLELKIRKDFFFHPNELMDYDLGYKLLTEICSSESTYAEDEMTRYCGFYGQAISYKVGEFAIMDLRKEFMKKNDNVPHDQLCMSYENKLKLFHTLILEKGNCSLEQLEQLMNNDYN